MRVVILASGSKANSMVVSFNDKTNILIDAGLSARLTFRRLLDAGIRPEDLTSVQITHEHTDHVAGLPGIIGKLPDLPVYMTRGTFGAMQWGEFRRPRVMLFDPGSNFAVNGVEVQSFSVPHDAAGPAGYSLEHGGERFAMATDLGSIPAEAETLLREADVLALESNHDLDVLAACNYMESLKRRIAGPGGHLSNAAACEFLAKDLAAKMVILTHLSESANEPELCRLSALEVIGGRYGLLIAGSNGGVS